MASDVAELSSKRRKRSAEQDVLLDFSTQPAYVDVRASSSRAKGRGHGKGQGKDDASETPPRPSKRQRQQGPRPSKGDGVQELAVLGHLVPGRLELVPDDLSSWSPDLWQYQKRDLT